MEMGINKKKHPSYGMLQFSRVASSNSHYLFGSSITHSNTIRMYLREGCVERDLNSDFYMADGLIAEVEMSYSQFAEAITSMNVGEGVPVTIKWLKDEGPIEACPFTDKRKQFEDEFKANLNKANETTQALIEEIGVLFSEKKNITKADREAVLSKLTTIQRSIGSSNNYLYQQFNEQMDKTTMEAKGEIEAFMQNKLNSIAQAALVEQLENPVSIETVAKSEVTVDE